MSEDTVMQDSVSEPKSAGIFPAAGSRLSDSPCYAVRILEKRRNMEQTKSKKPPLGIQPREIWEHKRVADIVAAMDRYNYEGMEIPAEWFTELYTLLDIKLPS